jgi:hypothetical protein
MPPVTRGRRDALHGDHRVRADHERRGNIDNHARDLVTTAVPAHVLDDQRDCRLDPDRNRCGGPSNRPCPRGEDRARRCYEDGEQQRGDSGAPPRLSNHATLRRGLHSEDAAGSPWTMSGPSSIA